MRATIVATLAALLVLVLSMVVNAGCGGSGKGGGDMAMAGPDMAEPDCVMDPQSANDILNACSDVQTGEASKDAPYFPSLAPNGTLPPLP